jgi:uncharacterized membrane protein YdjX (TVP38/TMEM64 family)
MLYLILKFFGINDILTDVKKLGIFIKSFGVFSYMVFILVYVVSSVLLLPGSILTISAGILFGPIKGGLISFAAANITMGISFLIARFVTKDVIGGKEKNKLYTKINDGITKYGVSFLILTRLVPIFPFSLQNYAYGLTRMKFTTYMLTSSVCIIPGTFLYAYLAGEIVNSGVSSGLLIKFTIAGIVLFLVSLLGKYLAKKKNIDIDEYK